VLTITLSSIDTHEEDIEVTLEHSLVSLSKWEALYEKPFFKKDSMEQDETLSYIEQMVVKGSLPDGWADILKPSDYNAVTSYINSKQTATWFREEPNPKGPSKIITNELIYYWMIDLGIPFDPCQNWHVNRLMTLIKVCSVHRTKPKKMSKQAQAEEYRRLNEERRKQLGTSG
jgi:hypothetical protein